MLLKPLDLAITIPLLGLVIASFFFVYTGTNGYSLVKLKGDSGEWVFPIDTDETMLISGPIGNTVITMHGATVRVTSSPCINQSCVATGAIRLPGQWAACLPNRVMVYISGGASPRGGFANDVDATTW
jgi:hypothetical protein